MMNHDIELKLQAYLDNEASTEDAESVASRVSQDGQAQALVEELRQTKQLLAGNELEVKLPESREFFWSKIERQIAPAPTMSRPRWSLAWGQWLIRLAAPAALLLAVLVMVFRPDSGTPRRAAYFHEVETPTQEANAITFHSQATGMTVVWIQSSEGSEEEAED